VLWIGKKNGLKVNIKWNSINVTSERSYGDGCRSIWWSIQVRELYNESMLTQTLGCRYSRQNYVLCSCNIRVRHQGALQVNTNIAKKCTASIFIMYTIIFFLKKKTVCSYEVLMPTNQITRCHISEHCYNLIFTSKKTPNPVLSTSKIARFSSGYGWFSLTYHTVASGSVAEQRPRDKQIYTSRCWLTASPRNMPPRKRLNHNKEKRCFLRDPCQGVINGTSLEFSQLWDSRQPARTLAEYIYRIRYQETTSEDIEDFMCAAVAVIFRVCKLVRLLYLLVVTSCVYKCSINECTNPTVYSHSCMWQLVSEVVGLETTVRRYIAIL
jgi:hypothetical protein